MKSIDELKQEQYDLKAKLHEVIELINSEEFYSITPREKTLITQQRAGMELYLNSLTKRIYGNDEPFCSNDTLWLSLLMGMFSTPFSTSSSTGYLKDQLKESDFESNES
jgi:hypothetical protein